MQRHIRKDKALAAKAQKAAQGAASQARKHAEATPTQRITRAICARALAWLKSQGDLIETDKEVDPDLEVTGLQKHMDGGCPVMFHNVKGKPNHRVITNLFGDMDVINKMFGWTSDAERVRKLAAALRKPLKPARSSTGRGAGAGARHPEAEGREQVGGADPAHDLRARADRRLRHPLRQPGRSSMAAPTSATTA